MKKSNNKKPNVYIGDYIRLEILGRGSFAIVYKARHKVTNELVAIKDINVERMPQKSLEAEISIMKDIKHQNIVNLIDCIKTETHVYLIMDYCSLGDLSSYLKAEYSKGMSETDLIHYLSQMASALEYLRLHDYVHRDIKPQNILLVPSADGSSLPTLKISDFGFARLLPNASLTTSYCGTPLYMAPEVVLRKSYDAKADLWSVGVLLYEMMMGRKMWQASQMFELENFLRTYKNNVDFSGSHHVFSNEIKSLVSVLLKKNPKERASCEEFFHYVELLKGSKSIESDDDDYVVVIDLKRSSSTSLDLNKMTLQPNHRYSSSAPPHLNGKRFCSSQISMQKYDSSEDEARPRMIRERKFSVGSAGSVLTKAISKAFFGSSGGGGNSPPSPTAPITPPIEEEQVFTSQTLVVEEMTLDKLLISSVKINQKEQPLEKLDNNPSLIQPPEYHYFIKELNHMIDIIDAVESFANTKHKQSDVSPFDSILAEETMVIYLKASSLMKTAMNRIEQATYTSENCTEMYKSLQMFHVLNLDKANKMSVRSGRQGHDTSSDLSIESLLYNHAVESSCKADMLEVTNEDLKGSLCLFEYSIQLLEAILQTEDASQISTEDRHIVKKLIRSISSRLDVVISKSNK